jgi:hypothetical protein
MDGVVLGRAHGVANVVGGLWPLLHISSFEMVFGPKTDRWLVKTVAGLLMVNGLTQLTTSSAWVLPLYSRRSTWSTYPPGGSPRCTWLTQLSKSAGSLPGTG